MLCESALCYFQNIFTLYPEAFWGDKNVNHFLLEVIQKNKWNHVYDSRDQAHPDWV